MFCEFMNNSIVVTHDESNNYDSKFFLPVNWYEAFFGTSNLNDVPSYATLKQTEFSIFSQY